MWRHSGFNYFSNCNNDQWLLPSTKSPTPETVFMPSLASARCVSLCICTCVLCANCIQNWQPKQMGLNFIPWLCDDLILNSLSWASSVFPSPIVSPSSKGSWWDYELCLCICALCSATGAHSIACHLPTPGSLWAGGRRWTGVQTPAGSRSTILCSSEQVSKDV